MQNGAKEKISKASKFNNTTISYGKISLLRSTPLECCPSFVALMKPTPTTKDLFSSIAGGFIFDTFASLGCEVFFTRCEIIFDPIEK